MGAVTGPTYIAEVAPKEIRGAIGILCEWLVVIRLTSQM